MAKRKHFACESGPAEIITDRYNGLLVPNYDAAALAQALNNLIFDNELLSTTTANARQSVAHLDIEEIAHEWDTIIKGLL